MIQGTEGLLSNDEMQNPLEFQLLSEKLDGKDSVEKVLILEQLITKSVLGKEVDKALDRLVRLLVCLAYVTMEAGLSIHRHWQFLLWLRRWFWKLPSRLTVLRKWAVEEVAKHITPEKGEFALSAFAFLMAVYRRDEAFSQPSVYVTEDERLAWGSPNICVEDLKELRGKIEELLRQTVTSGGWSYHSTWLWSKEPDLPFAIEKIFTDAWARLGGTRLMVRAMQALEILHPLDLYHEDRSTHPLRYVDGVSPGAIKFATEQMVALAKLDKSIREFVARMLEQGLGLHRYIGGTITARYHSLQSVELNCMLAQPVSSVVEIDLKSKANLYITEWKEASGCNQITVEFQVTQPPPLK